MKQRTDSAETQFICGLSYQLVFEHGANSKKVGQLFPRFWTDLLNHEAEI